MTRERTRDVDFKFSGESTLVVLILEAWNLPAAGQAIILQQSESLCRKAYHAEHVSAGNYILLQGNMTGLSAMNGTLFLLDDQLPKHGTPNNSRSNVEWTSHDDYGVPEYNTLSLCLFAGNPSRRDIQKLEKTQCDT